MDTEAPHKVKHDVQLAARLLHSRRLCRSPLHLNLGCCHRCLSPVHPPHLLATFFGGSGPLDVPFVEPSSVSSSSSSSSLSSSSLSAPAAGAATLTPSSSSSSPAESFSSSESSSSSSTLSNAITSSLLPFTSVAYCTEAGTIIGSSFARKRARCFSESGKSLSTFLMSLRTAFTSFAWASHIVFHTVTVKLPLEASMALS
mmetsp:Transcript_39245/g.89160  ORF Transcript_39245/g.89160 Transcript_39245/m.89160 type:complete len:201 (+) Transcript_39245:654-1256(+)